MMNDDKADELLALLRRLVEATENQDFSTSSHDTGLMARALASLADNVSDGALSASGRIELPREFMDYLGRLTAEVSQIGDHFNYMMEEGWQNTRPALERQSAALERIATAQERLAVIGLMSTWSKDIPTALAGADLLYAQAGEGDET